MIGKLSIVIRIFKFFIIDFFFEIIIKSNNLKHPKKIETNDIGLCHYKKL
jgi:hypothetical protein